MRPFIAASLAFACCSGLYAQSLAVPARVNSGDAPITVDVGHAAPFYADMDGDGLKDLLVGQFGEGKLRIYKNTGSAKEAKFKEFEWFKAGGETAKVPVG